MAYPHRLMGHSRGLGLDEVCTTCVHGTISLLHSDLSLFPFLADRAGFPSQ